jgi:hypothetical protein
MKIITVVIAAVAIIAVVAIVSAAAHFLFSPWLLLVAAAAVAWFVFQGRRARR